MENNQEITSDAAKQLFESGCKAGLNEGIEKGYKEGVDDCERERLDGDDYEVGLETAWEYSSKLESLDLDVLLDLFGEYNTGFIRKNFTAAEVIAKIRNYEEAEKEDCDPIRIGHEVIYDSERAVVSAIIDQTIMLLGFTGSYMVRTTEEHVKRTGRYFPELEEMLKKMEANEE